jgi:arylsulfatase A-like enzyme
LLQRALDFIDAKVGDMQQAIKHRGLGRDTVIVLSAKHGQSPLDPNQLTRIDDGKIVDAINAEWQKHHSGNVIVAGTNDDAWQSYVVPKTQAAADFVKRYLWTHDATGNTATGGTRTLPHSGLAQIFAGDQAADYFGVPVSDPRRPDVWGRVQVGVVYTGGHGKIAEHGGSNPGDRDVPILVYAPNLINPHVSGRWVETTQIAPTILQLLGLDPNDLGAVQVEGTKALPGT